MSWTMISCVRFSSSYRSVLKYHFLSRDHETLSDEEGREMCEDEEEGMLLTQH